MRRLSKLFKWGSHICAWLVRGSGSRHKPKKPGALMMSCELLRSARSDSPVEECNLHHTPRRLTRPFNQRILFFGGVTPADSPRPGPRRTSAFRIPDGPRWQKWCLCYFVSKAKYHFQFLTIPCSLCGSAPPRRRAGAVSEWLNPQESWFWPNLSTQSEVFHLPLRQMCRSQRRSPRQGDAPL